MTLGQKLRNMRKLKEEAGLDPKHRMSLEKLEAERASRIALLGKIDKDIRAALEAGTEVEITIEHYPSINWLKQAGQGGAPFQNLFDERMGRWKLEDEIEVEFISVDGGNIKITVDPGAPVPKM